MKKNGKWIFILVPFWLRPSPVIPLFLSGFDIPGADDNGRERQFRSCRSELQAMG